MVIYLCICLLVHSFVLVCLQLFIYAFYLFQNHRWTWHPVTISYLFILFGCLFVRSFVCSFVQSINQSFMQACIYLFISRLQWNLTASNAFSLYGESNEFWAICFGSFIQNPPGQQLHLSRRDTSVYRCPLSPSEKTFHYLFSQSNRL